MNNLQADGWDLSDVKYVELSDKEVKRWRLATGDIVFNRTNSKELVGKCEVFDQSGVWVFASYLIRLRVEAEKAKPEFVAAFLNTRAGRAQIDRESRQIIGMSNINAAEIRTLRVPLPPPSKQLELVKRLDAARSERRARLKRGDDLVPGLDRFILTRLGLTLPPREPHPVQGWGVRLRETLNERRLDPHRFAPRTRKLREMIGNGRFKTRPLSALVTDPISGDWGLADDERVPEVEYVRCLIIRATEFDDRENLILDNERVRFRYLERKSFEIRSLQAGDVVLEKSGGGPLQPVGRVAIIEPEYLKNGDISFSNFVMRLRPTDEVLPIYLWAFLGFVNRCGLTESMQAQTHGIRNLKMDEYFEQSVPLPPRETQEEIVAEVLRRRDEARRLRSEARAIWDDAKRDFEEELLGPGIVEVETKAFNAEGEQRK